MPRSGNEVLLSQYNVARGKCFELSTEYPEGPSQPLLCRFTELKSALAQILIIITVCKGSVPQVFFVLHPAEAQNHSLKGAKLAITLYSRLFVYIRMHAQSRNDVL